MTSIYVEKNFHSLIIIYVFPITYLILKYAFYIYLIHIAHIAHIVLSNKIGNAQMQKIRTYIKAHFN